MARKMEEEGFRDITITFAPDWAQLVKQLADIHGIAESNLIAMWTRDRIRNELEHPEGIGGTISQRLRQKFKTTLMLPTD